MEHRLSKRQPLQYPVELRSVRYGVLAATTRDICRDGMLVDIGAATLPMYSQVILHIDLNRVRYRLHAMVVHVSPAGVGLMYGDFDDDARRTLYTALRLATHAEAAGARLPFWLHSAATASSGGDPEVSR